MLLLKIRVKRRTGELRHLRLAFFHDPLEFLGAEDASIGAHEYPVLEVVWHVVAPFYISSSYGSPLKPDGCFENCGQMCISQNSTTLFFLKSSLNLSKGRDVRTTQFVMLKPRCSLIADQQAAFSRLSRFLAELNEIVSKFIAQRADSPGLLEFLPILGVWRKRSRFHGITDSRNSESAIRDGWEAVVNSHVIHGHQ